MIINFVQKKYFILLFIILSFTTYKLLYLENSNKIENYLQTKTEHIYLEYKVIYNNHKKLANFIFTNDINKKPIIDLFKNRDRENLLKYLNDDYKNLRLFNIRQLHFHLPNNNSFLRMHRPNKFGDSLTKDRLTVKYVNEEKEYIDGFEEGKVFNGFRFVYPLFDSKKHIGSVEISYSGLFFIKEIMKHYKLKTNLLISKKVVDKKVFDDEHSNYIDSFIDGYYFQKSIANYLNIDFSKNKLSKELSDSIKNSIAKGTPSSIYDEQNDRQIITIIPLRNPITKNIVAALTVRSNDTFIKSKNTNTKVMFIIVLTTIAIILILIYKQLLYQIHLQQEVKKKTKELRKLNENLKDKIKKEIAKNIKKDRLVQEQSKLASMGEMIGSIAHQWRQPLNALNINIQNLDDDYEDGLIDEKFIEKFIKKNRTTIEFMSHTIDNFRNFFRIDKEKKLFSIKDAIYSVLSIQNAQLENNNISVDIKGDDFEVLGLNNEFQQVILNIVNNAKDVFIDKKMKNGKITIRYSQNKITIADNAGGISQNILDRIFEPYFTTKEQGKGTGMGLYISKLIIEDSMNGTLTIQNDIFGAIFVIEFNPTKGVIDEQLS